MDLPSDPTNPLLSVCSELGDELPQTMKTIY